MARPLRVEFPGAIYHVMSRGNARQRIFRAAADYERFMRDLEEIVQWAAWELLTFVLMPNHVHLFLRTPEANLSRGMQRLLSGYANWHAARHRRPGHLLQGRFKGEMVEDERYFWTVSRYIHLNPTRGKRPLVAHPRDWPWSSYPGYDNPQQRLSWVAYDAIYNTWQGEFGGADPVSSYRRYVEAGVTKPTPNPFLKAKFGWLLGEPAFADQMRRLMTEPNQVSEVPYARRLRSLDTAGVLAAVASFYSVEEAIFSDRGNGHRARAVAAWLLRRHTTATLRELAPSFGLTRPDSVRNLTRRVDQQRAHDRTLQDDIRALENLLAAPPASTRLFSP